MNMPLHTSLRVLPLQNGDRLTREEFERRYFAMPHVNKAELIEGIVYMPSPVNHEFHSGPHADLVWWTTSYRVHTPGLDSGDNATVRLDLDNEAQPDVLIFIKPNHGGRIELDKGYITGSPELVAEVSASTASIDLNMKLTAYQRNNVLEYIVWRVYDEAIDWFVMRDGYFAPLVPDTQGILKSETFPGLWLDVAAMLQRDLEKVLVVLNQGLASPEHVAFIASLNAKR